MYSSTNLIWRHTDSGRVKQTSITSQSELGRWRHVKVGITQEVSIRRPIATCKLDWVTNLIWRHTDSERFKVTGVASQSELGRWRHVKVGITQEVSIRRPIATRKLDWVYFATNLIWRHTDSGRRSQNLDVDVMSTAQGPLGTNNQITGWRPKLYVTNVLSFNTIQQDKA